MHMTVTLVRLVTSASSSPRGTCHSDAISRRCRMTPLCLLARSVPLFLIAFPSAVLGARAIKSRIDWYALSRPAAYREPAHSGGWCHTPGDDGPDGPQQPTCRVDLHARERCTSAEDRGLAQQARAIRAEPQRPAPQGRPPAEAIGHATGTKAPRCLMTARTAFGDTGLELGGGATWT